MKSIEQRERELIVRYIRSLEGDFANVEFQPVLREGCNLRAVFVNGKFYQYHADLVDMAKSVGMK